MWTQTRTTASSNGKTKKKVEKNTWWEVAASSPQGGEATSARMTCWSKAAQQSTWYRNLWKSQKHGYLNLALSQCQVCISSHKSTQVRSFFGDSPIFVKVKPTKICGSDHHRHFETSCRIANSRWAHPIQRVGSTLHQETADVVRHPADGWKIQNGLKAQDIQNPWRV